jgi:glycosyltransferase involved in cell wall biosynthesis
MKLLVVPDPSAPYGEDAFCRELAARASARGHEVSLTAGPVPAQAVFINGFQSAPFLAARAAGSKTAVRLIDSFAEVPDRDLPPIRELLTQADRVLVPSRYLERLVRSWGAGDRARIVPYAYDRVRAKAAALITMRASRPSDFQIVSNSKFTESCVPGLELLMAAVNRLRFEWHLTIAGEGPLLESVRERARRLLPPNKVLFPGALPHLKIMEFFRAAKAYVNATGAEGFPSMALYALSEGCPVVAPRFGAVTELIQAGQNGLLYNPGDPASLCEALVTLRSEEGLSLKLIAEGVKTVEAHTWDATIAAAFSALEELNP